MMAAIGRNMYMLLLASFIKHLFRYCCVIDWYLHLLFIYTQRAWLISELAPPPQCWNRANHGNNINHISDKNHYYNSKQSTNIRNNTSYKDVSNAQTLGEIFRMPSYKLPQWTLSAKDSSSAMYFTKTAILNFIRKLRLVRRHGHVSKVTGSSNKAPIKTTFINYRTSQHVPVCFPWVGYSGFHLIPALSWWLFWPEADAVVWQCECAL
jgi:hypothetical protein